MTIWTWYPDELGSRPCVKRVNRTPTTGDITPGRRLRLLNSEESRKKKEVRICLNSTGKKNFFGKKSCVFIVAGQVRVAFEPKSFQSDFNRIRYKAPDGHCDSVQSGPRPDPDKKFVLANDHMDVVP